MVARVKPLPLITVQMYFNIPQMQQNEAFLVFDTGIKQGRNRPADKNHLQNTRYA
jgi:hypothetical protein